MEVGAAAGAVAKRRDVTQADVDGAADAILAKGERPTVDRIRTRLGTGSPNTLGPLIDNWYRELSQRVAGPQAASPAGVPRAAMNAFQLLWDTALEEARAAAANQLASAQERLAHDQAALAEDRRVMQATHAAIEQAAQTARERIRELEEQVVATRQQLQRAQQAAGAATDRAAQLQQDLARAHREQQEQGAAHEGQRQREAERNAANERRLLVDVDRARGEAKSAQEEIRRLQARLDEQERTSAGERTQLQGRLDSLAGQLAARDEEVAHARAALARAQELEGSLRDLAATAQARTTDLLAALESERAVSNELRAQAKGGAAPMRRRSAARPAPARRAR